MATPEGSVFFTEENRDELLIW